MTITQRTPAGPARTITGREWVELCGQRVPVHATLELPPAGVAALDVPDDELGNYVEVVTEFGSWTVLRGDVMRDESEDDGALPAYPRGRFPYAETLSERAWGALFNAGTALLVLVGRVLR